MQNGKVELLESKASPKRVWEPSKSTVERVPNVLVVSRGQPGVMNTAHWHAQVEINFVFRGTMQYRMHGHNVHLKAGDLALFWGGLPHQLVDTSDDPLDVAIHLPLVHFFRLRLAPELMRKLTHGATLVTRSLDDTDFGNFNRWTDYMRSGDLARHEHAIHELLLRLERVSFEPFYLAEPPDLPSGDAEPINLPPYANIAGICAYIAENFRYDIDSVDIAHSADIHPKYAMSVFKRSTGMTLSEYVNLLRLSYAQAMLMKDEANILRIAMESGFGSLSAFNKSFVKLTGKSPSRFRRETLTQRGAPDATQPAAIEF